MELGVKRKEEFINLAIQMQSVQSDDILLDRGY